MMEFLLSPIVRWLGAAMLLGLAGLSTVVWMQSQEMRLLRRSEFAAIEKARVANEVIRQFQEDADRNRRIIAEQASILARIEASKEDAVREIVRAKPSSQCAGVAVIGNALERLRQWSKTDGDGRAPPAGRAGAALPGASDAGKVGGR